MEGAAAVGLPQAQPVTGLALGDQLVEHAGQEGGGDDAQVMDALVGRLVMEAAVGAQVAAGGDGGEVAAARVLEDVQEDRFALAVHGDVDVGVLAQEGLGLVGDLRSAEDHQGPRMPLLELPGQAEGGVLVPDVAAEPGHVGALQLGQHLLDGGAPEDRRQEAQRELGRGVLLGVGLQQPDGQRQVVLPGEAVVNLNEADGQRRLRGGVHECPWADASARPPTAPRG